MLGLSVLPLQWLVDPVGGIVYIKHGWLFLMYVGMFIHIILPRLDAPDVGIIVLSLPWHVETDVRIVRVCTHAKDSSNYCTHIFQSIYVLFLTCKNNDLF
jgi:hypothetical protein